MHTYPSPSTSTQTTEMDLRSGSKDLIVPSLMFMSFLHGTFLSSGKPPGRPPNSDLVGETSQSVSPNLDSRGIEEMEDQATVLGGLGQLKSNGDLLPSLLSPPLISRSALREEENGRINLPIHIFGMRNVREEIINMTNTSMEVSLALSLLSSVDLCWKYQLLVEYSKDLHTCMILDDLQQDEGYLVEGGVI